MEKIGFFQDDHEIDGLSATSGWAAYQLTDADLDKVTLGFGQSSSVTAYELLRAYSIFANDGQIVEPYLVEKIIDSEDNVTYSAKVEKTEKALIKSFKSTPKSNSSSLSL